MRDLKRFPIVKLDDERQKHIEDEVVVEEPLEVRVNGQSISVVMRTPGDDFDLAIGFLWTEGIIHSCDEIGTMAYCPDEKDPELKNIVNVGLVDAKRKPESSRWSWANSSCGLCGKATLDAIHQACKPITGQAAADREVLCSLPLHLRRAQTNFDRTGGIHAVALFDLHGRLLMVREDIGRHNAVDKMLGASLAARLPVNHSIMMVSGRLGFEIAQKALVAGIPIVASISAPSSLAIELARDFRMTVIGFLRGRTMNVYTHPERVIGPLP
jgi:FdhD protein